MRSINATSNDGHFGRAPICWCVKIVVFLCQGARVLAGSRVRTEYVES